MVNLMSEVENILFNLPYNERRYKATLEVLNISIQPRMELTMI
jgi:hypothetical protein